VQFFSNAGYNMAKPNYKFEKRQKDLAKKKKQEEKRLRKQAATNKTSDDEQDSAEDSADADETEETPSSE
jgi:hypothetical protein